MHPAEDFLDSARCVVENFLRLVLLAVLGRDEFFLLGNAPSLSVPLQDSARKGSWSRAERETQRWLVKAGDGQEQRGGLHLSEVFALFL